MARERRVAFFSGGVPLAGVLTLPDGAGSARLPGVVLCHGFLCTMAMDLPEIAARIAAAGFAVLRFDYRGFGESGGELRGELVPLRQSDDARAAVSLLRTQPECDPERIALWGTSFGGAVVLHVAALDERVRAVVANVPVTDGHSWIRAVNSAAQWAELRRRLDADRERRALTGASEVVPVTAFRPPAPSPDPDRDAFFARHAAHAGPRECSWASVDAVLDFAPVALAGRIAPRPLLLVASESDAVVPFSQAEAAFAAACAPKRLAVLPPGTSHFAVYVDPALAAMVEETVGFLREALPA